MGTKHMAIFMFDNNYIMGELFLYGLEMYNKIN